MGEMHFAIIVATRSDENNRQQSTIIKEKLMRKNMTKCGIFHWNGSQCTAQINNATEQITIRAGIVSILCP